ncbi:ABC transporter permease [Ferrimicrobium acidiphilum]|uniref:ABC transporter permease n=1 Tax=Ferrimicrobium acidiphilum TaxID=121039 RepID=UPI0023F3E502|nr:ABC transporter permease [Ferrimicrobium acidiphilum]
MRTKSAGAIAAIAMVTLVMTASVTFMLLRGDGFTSAVNTQIDQLAPRAITVIHTVGSGGAYGTLPTGTISRLSQLSNVEGVAPIAEGSELAQSPSGATSTVSVIETTPNYAKLTGTTMDSGSFLLASGPSVVLNSTAAVELGVTGNLPTPIQVGGLAVSVVGVTNASGSVGPQPPVAYLNIDFAPEPYQAVAVVLEAQSIGDISEISTQATAEVGRLLVVDNLGGRVRIITAGSVLVAARQITGIVGSFSDDAMFAEVILSALLVGVVTWVTALRARHTLAVQLGYGASLRSLLVGYATQTLIGTLIGDLVGSAMAIALISIFGYPFPGWMTLLADVGLASAVALVVAELASSFGIGVFITGRTSVESLLD